MTYTIIARCPRTARLGIAIATFSLGVGGYCPFVRTAIAAVSSQAYANPDLGPLALRLLGLGYSGAKTLAELAGQDPHFAYRQVGIVDRAGQAVAHTGADTRPWAGHLIGEGFVAMGNVLAGRPVVQAIADGFAAAADQAIDERLLAALEAGRDAGGQQGGDGRHLAERSAALIMVGGAEVAELDLRVDAHDAAVDELRRVHGAYRPYLPYYELRAKDPPNTPAQDVWARQHLGET